MHGRLRCQITAQHDALKSKLHFTEVYDWCDLPLDEILNEDCAGGMRRFPAGSIDLAFADPPFNIGYEYDVYEDSHAAEDYLAWCRQWIGEIHRVLKPDAAFWLAIGDEFAAELKVLAQREAGFTCRSWVVWYYTFGVNCTKKFSRSHVHLFHFVKNAQQFTFSTPARFGYHLRDNWSMAIPRQSGRPLARRHLADSAASIRIDVGEKHFYAASAGFSRQLSIGRRHVVLSSMAAHSEQPGWHGCQMPEQLLGRIIRACSNAGEVVLDPFGGSGTTPAVAKKLGRRFLGFELSNEYAANIRKRLESIQVGDELEGCPNRSLCAEHRQRHFTEGAGAKPKTI